MLDGLPFLDLSQLKFEEFLSFFFDHDIQKEEYWYLEPDFQNSNHFDDKDVSSPRVIVEHLTRLFTEFAAIAPRYSPPQINAGIWAMFCGFQIQKYLWFPSTPLERRVSCIRSMYFVYSDYVAKSSVEVMENCFDMWWESVASGFWAQMHFDCKSNEGDVLSLNAEHKALLNAMFETLTKILALTDTRTQIYALHGLGHLHHPGVRDLVQQFLDEHRNNFTSEGINWVEKCRDGTVM
ncbi:MAG TPA: hypothetical protein VFB79_18095 [Candidatus Angelobacter sp.]|nr:hypothetical protein [Candidatus Angelobacter sp.]